MRIPVLILAVFIAVAAGLTGFWFYASRTAAAALGHWIEAEAAQGRQWSCPGETITGFPFALALHCDHPSYEGRAGADRAVIALGGLTISISLGDPFHAAMELQPPFTFHGLNAPDDATVTWAKMQGTAGGLPRRADTVTLSGTSIAAGASSGAQNQGAVKMASADLTFHMAHDGADKVLQFQIALRGVDAPDLDKILGQAPEGNGLTLAGQIDKPVFVNEAPDQAIELWRRAGGAITFWQARLTHGASSAEASGPLHLDDQHRIAGRLEARFAGLDPVLRHYGINAGLAKAGSVLNQLFGKKNEPGAAPAEASGADSVKLPVTFKDGRLGVGPFVTPVQLRPLY
jgi:hypothetical protein